MFDLARFDNPTWSTAGKDAFSALMSDFGATVDVLWPQDSLISQESVGRLETQGCQNMKALVDIVRINNSEYENKLSILCHMQNMQNMQLITYFCISYIFCM
jgi:hypothetical protein